MSQVLSQMQSVQNVPYTVGFVSRAAFQIGMAQLSQTKIESGVWNQESDSVPHTEQASPPEQASHWNWASRQMLA